MTLDDVNRWMEKCICCGRAWDEHPGTQCLRYKPEARKRVEALIAENARLLLELEQVRGEYAEYREGQEQFFGKAY